MFAVLKTGGKQYRVKTGDTLRVEKLAADAGETIQFNDVLMVDETVGTPYVEGAAVQAEVVDQIRGEKVIHFVRRRRKHSSKRRKGHRQYLTVVKVTSILPKGGAETGVKAAVGAGVLPRGETVAPPARHAANRTEQAEMSARVATGGAPDKPADAPAAPSGTRPSNLLDAARGGAPDDLKRIAGLGPKMADLLNENGVFHFDQIAAWNDDEIAYMDEKLSLRGRIARDGWVDQAKALAEEQE
jgi:large subunit ribosomal protein L21